MKKIIFLIFVLSISSSLFFFTSEIRAWSFAAANILDIAPKNIYIGEETEGIIRAEVSCSFPDNLVEASAWVEYGDSSGSERLGDCRCESIGPDAMDIVRVSCDFYFSHRYDIAGTYDVIPSVLSGGSGFTGIGTFRDGPAETVTVTEAPTPSTPDFPGNPLFSTNVAPVIMFIARFIFYLVVSMAVLLVAVGGFLILTAAGSPEQIIRGRKMIFYALLGVALTSLARGIVALIYRILGL